MLPKQKTCNRRNRYRQSTREWTKVVRATSRLGKFTDQRLGQRHRESGLGKCNVVDKIRNTTLRSDPNLTEGELRNQLGSR